MCAVEAQDMSVRLDGHYALKEVTCHVPVGDFLAIVGPNGAGKSTFIKVMLGLLRPTSGSMKLYGLEPRSVPPDWIGYVPQFKTMDLTFPAQCVELVISRIRRRWPWSSPRKDRATAIAALEKVGAAHLAERQINALSGGELQRVFLACGLVRRPRLIIMDEPATGMDIIGQKSLYQTLEEYRKETGATIVMVTHDWGIAGHHATYVLVLNSALISFGPPAEALQNKHLRRAYGHVGHPMLPGME